MAGPHLPSASERLYEYILSPYEQPNNKLVSEYAGDFDQAIKSYQIKSGVPDPLTKVPHPLLRLSATSGYRNARRDGTRTLSG